ncbi:MAG: hypothetical protein ACTSUO_04825 [Candidatus Thorarchaeota archaeon]
MSSSIQEAWNLLYEANPKIQSLAVCKGAEIVWQTQNWDLVKEVQELVDAPAKGSSFVKINGVEYHRVTSSVEAYVASSKKGKGHFLMTKVAGSTWLMAWVSNDAVPELAMIDLSYAALKLSGAI